MAFYLAIASMNSFIYCVMELKVNATALNNYEPHAKLS